MWELACLRWREWIQHRYRRQASSHRGSDRFQVASAWLTMPLIITAAVAKAAGITNAVSTCSKFQPRPSKVAPIHAPRIAPKRPMPSIHDTPVARPWVG